MPDRLTAPAGWGTLSLVACDSPQDVIDALREPAPEDVTEPEQE